VPLPWWSPCWSLAGQPRLELCGQSSTTGSRGSKACVGGPARAACLHREVYLTRREQRGRKALTNVDGLCYARVMDTGTLTRLLPVRHKNEPSCAPAQPPRLTSVQTATLADRLKALSDETRLRMLDLLAQQETPLCVCDITDQFALGQPTISHHLRL